MLRSQNTIPAADPIIQQNIAINKEYLEENLSLIINKIMDNFKREQAKNNKLEEICAAAKLLFEDGEEVAEPRRVIKRTLPLKTTLLKIIETNPEEFKKNVVRVAINMLLSVQKTIEAENEVEKLYKDHLDFFLESYMNKNDFEKKLAFDKNLKDGFELIQNEFDILCSDASHIVPNLKEKFNSAVLDLRKDPNSKKFISLLKKCPPLLMFLTSHQEFLKALMVKTKEVEEAIARKVAEMRKAEEAKQALKDSKMKVDKQKKRPALTSPPISPVAASPAAARPVTTPAVTNLGVSNPVATSPLTAWGHFSQVVTKVKKKVKSNKVSSNKMTYLNYLNNATQIQDKISILLMVNKTQWIKNILDILIEQIEAKGDKAAGCKEVLQHIFVACKDNHYMDSINTFVQAYKASLTSNKTKSGNLIEVIEKIEAEIPRTAPSFIR